MMVITSLKKNENSARKEIPLFKLKQKIRSKANTMQQLHTSNSIHF